MGGKLGDARAHGQRDRLLPDGHADLGQPLANSLGRPDRTVEVRVRQHDHKLFASVARHMIYVAHGRPQDLCNGLEGLVSGEMAMFVVELLEPVDIRHEDRERLLRPARAAHFALQRFHQVAAVRDPGELVGHQQRLELLASFA